MLNRRRQRGSSTKWNGVNWIRVAQNSQCVTVQHSDFGSLSFQVIIFNYAFFRRLRQHNIHESESLNNFKINVLYLRSFNNDHSSFDSRRVESTQGKQPLDIGTWYKILLWHTFGQFKISRNTSSYHKQLCCSFVQNVHFSRQFCWRFQPSGMVRCLVGRELRYVSNDRILLIFRVILNLSPNYTASLPRRLESSMFQFLRGKSRSNFWPGLSSFDCFSRSLNRRLDVDHWRWTGKGLAGGRYVLVGRWLRWNVAQHEAQET